MTKDKTQLLYIVLTAFFLCNAIIAEFIGVKIFSVEAIFGFSPINIRFIGPEKLSLNMTAGVVLWPIVFLMTDVINEFYGRKGVRWASFLAAGLILYAFVMVYIAIHLPPADFWLVDTQTGILRNEAFKIIFGQGLWIIAGSIATFLVSQLVDVYTFHLIRRITGSKRIWLRALGSTLISQLLDSFLVLYIAFYLGSDWGLTRVLNVGLINYAYKFLVAILLLPLLYLVHHAIEWYLGKEAAHRLSNQAHLQSPASTIL